MEITYGDSIAALAAAMDAKAMELLRDANATVEELDTAQGLAETAMSAYMFLAHAMPTMPTDHEPAAE